MYNITFSSCRWNNREVYVFIIMSVVTSTFAFRLLIYLQTCNFRSKVGKHWSVVRKFVLLLCITHNAVRKVVAAFEVMDSCSDLTFDYYFYFYWWIKSLNETFPILLYASCLSSCISYPKLRCQHYRNVDFLWSFLFLFPASSWEMEKVWDFPQESKVIVFQKWLKREYNSFSALHLMCLNH